MRRSSNRGRARAVRPLKRIGTLVCAVLVALGPTPAGADPCGMVPPIYLAGQRAIARIGLQKTYCFHKNGMETLVIRPGFSGNVEEFGMLIPFPTPPAVRKVSDHIFEHIAAAIDPPEVVIDLRPTPDFQGFGGGGLGGAGGAASYGLAVVPADQTRVIREEAVGMYDVVVLEAGSTEALKKWMDEHGYRYPAGMDKACDDYVKAGWCFVAVRTRINEKRGLDPRPGQTGVATGLAPDASFDGHVQAMGFRFHSESLVVPMRLSTFNEGDLHNVVYLLTDRPMRIDSIPDRFVVRQVSGRELYRNLTELLPVRLIGGTIADLKQWHHDNLAAGRDPIPVNGAARDLFAGDLLCAREQQLENPYEAIEKMLLRIGERLNMRGPAVDQLNLAALEEQRRGIVESALEDLYSMTLTVIDGDFPREVLARDNLTFSKFAMNDGDNRPSAYNARLFAPDKPEGQLIRGPIRRVDGATPPSKTPRTGGSSESPGRSSGFQVPAGAAIPVAMLVAGLAMVCLRRRRLAARWAVFLAAATGATTAAWGQTPQRPTPMHVLIRQWDDPETADQAVEEMIEYQERALAALARQVSGGETLARQGWAIVCLSEIPGKRVDRMLAAYERDDELPPLVRTWAAAARVRRMDTLHELFDVARLSSNPALDRPVQKRMEELLASGIGGPTLSELLRMSAERPQLNQLLGPAILGFGADAMCREMLTSDDPTIRRQAAAFAATLAAQGDADVATRVIRAVAFDPELKRVPWAWNDGPLFLPSLSWSPDEALDLLGELLAWRLWCEKHDAAIQLRQLNNNLMNVAQFAGVSPVSWDSAGWFRAWAAKADPVRRMRFIEQLDYAVDPETREYLEAIDKIQETTYLKSGGSWQEVGVVERAGVRARIVYLARLEKPAVEWVHRDDLMEILDEERAIEKAAVDGKYQTLLHTIPAPRDIGSYGEFTDFGRWTGTSYVGFNNLSPGFWVYVFPNWYIWKEQVRE